MVSYLHSKVFSVEGVVRIVRTKTDLAFVERLGSSRSLLSLGCGRCSFLGVSPTTKHFRPRIELTINVRNLHSYHGSKSRGSLSAPLPRLIN